MTETPENTSALKNDELPTSPVIADQPDDNQVHDDQVLNRVIKRFGGRHLIFRTQLGSWKFLPKPYAMVSTFRGPIWFFYGIGQVWITHRKYHEFDGWMSRIPRIPAPKIVELLDLLNTPLTEFTHFCNQHGIEGTVVIEAKRIEFHWTFDYTVEKESMKQTHTSLLDAPFQELVDCYLAAKNELGI